jgi:hypothetical protein
MTLTIQYRHRDQPEEAGMTMIPAQGEVAATVDKLEKRGFVIDKITVRSSADAVAAVDPLLGPVGGARRKPSIGATGARQRAAKAAARAASRK